MQEQTVSYICVSENEEESSTLSVGKSLWDPVSIFRVLYKLEEERLVL